MHRMGSLLSWEVSFSPTISMKTFHSWMPTKSVSRNSTIQFNDGDDHALKRHKHKVWRQWNRHYTTEHHENGCYHSTVYVYFIGKLTHLNLWKISGFNRKSTCKSPVRQLNRCDMHQFCNVSKRFTEKRKTFHEYTLRGASSRRVQRYRIQRWKKISRVLCCSERSRSFYIFAPLTSQRGPSRSKHASQAWVNRAEQSLNNVKRRCSECSITFIVGSVYIEDTCPLNPFPNSA